MSGRFCTITDTCGKILYRNPVGGRTVRYRTRIRLCEYRIVPYCNDTLYRIGYEYEYCSCFRFTQCNRFTQSNRVWHGHAMDIEMDKDLENEP